MNVQYILGETICTKCSSLYVSRSTCIQPNHICRNQVSRKQYLWTAVLLLPMPTTIIRIGTKILTRGITDDSILLTRPEEMDGGQLMQAEQQNNVRKWCQGKEHMPETPKSHDVRTFFFVLWALLGWLVLSFLSPANVVGEVVGEVTKG